MFHFDLYPISNFFLNLNPLVILYLPFYKGGDVFNKAHNASKRLQNVSLKSNVLIRNKTKIEDITNYLRYGKGFTCFKLFPLTSYNAFQVMLNFKIIILFLIFKINIIIINIKDKLIKNHFSKIYSNGLVFLL